MGAADSKHRARPSRHPSHLAADRPSPPGKPQLVPSDKHSPEPDVVTIRWEPPLHDGGSRITGYLVEHRRTGSPHWVRSSPALVPLPELTLSGLEPGWRYQFRVSAQNSVGLSQPGDLSELLTVTLQRTAASAPHFIRELRDTVALENEKAELSVQVRGTPTPTIAWFKDGVEIFSSRSYRVVTDNETSTLVIHQAALSDEGEVKCSATNRVGYAVTRAKLTLQAPPSIRLPRQYEEGLLFEKDEVIRLKVSVAGRPVPEVTWQLNGEPVPGGGRYEAAHLERYATLRVGEARRSDRGEYQVRAVNSLGEDIASFLVTVADRPMSPARAKVVMALGRSVTLSWTTPEDDGGCKIGNYIVEYYRLGWNMWLKAATCRQLSTTLGELIEGSEYKFRVKAENPYGVSDPSPESDVVFIPDPKRGLLEPPEHGPIENESSMDMWLEDKKRPISTSPTIDETYGERKTKKKRGPMAPPRQLKPDVTRDRTEKHSMMSEDSLSPPATPENYHPVIPKRRGKLEKPEVKKEPKEDKEYLRNIQEKRKVEDFKKFENIRKAEELRRIEEIKNSDEFKKGVDVQKDEYREKGRDAKKNNITNVPEDKNRFDMKTKMESKLSEPPTSPRIEHDALHGSSELMLVLVPNSRAATEERETSKRELFESSMALEGDVAPPMSLSAPELGSGDPLELPPVRAAFSSTELLHERAMARFYQDMAQEEAESSLKRRSSLQRRRSFERRSSYKGSGMPELAESLQDIASSVRSLTEKIENTSNKPAITTSRVQPGRKTFSKDSMDSVLSTEEPNRKHTLVQQTSEEDMEYEDSSYDEDEEDEYDEEEEEALNEDIMDEELEEELEEEEEDEEEFSIDEKSGVLYTSESEEDMRYAYTVEEDTYHPRALNLKYNEDTMISAYEGRGPLILGSIPSGPPTIPKNDGESSTAQTNSSSNYVKLKPILKRSKINENNEETNEKTEIDQRASNTEGQTPTPSLVTEKRYEPNFSPVMPKPILKVKEPSQEKLSPVIQRRGVPMAGVEAELNLNSSKINIDDGSDYETSVKKKQVRIEEPKDTNEKKENESQATTSEETPRQRTGSLIEEADATRVMISHYSDIVAEYGKGKRPPKTLYLNYEALKAAAEEEENRAAKIPEVLISEPEPQAFNEEQNKEQNKEENPIKVEIPNIKYRQVKEERSAVKLSQVKEKRPAVKFELLEERSVVTFGTVKEEMPTVKFESLREEHFTQKREAPVEPPSKEKPSSMKKKRSPSPLVRCRTKEKEIPPTYLSKEIPFEKTEQVRTPSPVLPQRKYTLTEKKVHSYFDYLMDLSLFILACWLYLFKDERLSIPVLCLMIYRQAHDALRRKIEAVRNRLPRRILFWRRQ